MTANRRYIIEHWGPDNWRTNLLKPIWRFLPGRVQGWACRCSICRGEAW